MNNDKWPIPHIHIHPVFWFVTVLAIWGGFFLEIVTLFSLIVIHELGHLSAARYFGWRLTKLEILPFGGVLETDEWGTVRSREEMIVALAGPAYNALMIVFGGVCYIAGWWSDDWAYFFVTANAWLALFNLLPVYPLDGGRIVQALFSYHLSFRACIQWTLGISLIMSMTMCIISLLPLTIGRPFMLNVFVIALFLLVSNLVAWRHKHFQYMRFLIHRQTDETVYLMPVYPIVVVPEDTVLDTVQRWKKEAYHVLVVRDASDRVLRILPEEQVIASFFHRSAARRKLREWL